MRYTKKEVENILESINGIINKNKITFELAYRNGFTYVEYKDTKKTVFNNALNTKALYLQLYAFREGLIFKNN